MDGCPLLQGKERVDASLAVSITPWELKVQVHAMSSRKELPCP